MRLKYQLMLGFSATVVVAAAFIWQPWETMDALFWPSSARGRITESAEILKKLRGPARWCYPSRNGLNLVANSSEMRSSFGACVAQIEPVSDFIETPRAEIQRFYRGKHGALICEINLSTVWNDDRIVGSDCYYGLFREQDDTGVGMTDDNFG